AELQKRLDGVTNFFERNQPAFLRLEQDARTVDESFDERVRAIHTRYLVRIAERLLVSLPPQESPDWKKTMLGDRYLSDEAFVRGRTAIREEKKSRREEVLGWLPAIGTVTGVIGALTGLFAILLKK